MDSPVTKPWNTASFCNIAGALRWQAERQPGSTAVLHAGTRNLGPGKSSSYSFLELNELSGAYARGLESLGISRGDRVFLLEENSICFPVFFTALARLGAVPVVALPGMSPDATKLILEKTRPKALVGSPAVLLARKLKGLGKSACEISVSTGPSIPGVATGLKTVYSLGMNEVREVFHNSEPGEIAAISCTETQGSEPEVVMHTHGELAAQAEAIREAFDITPGEVGLSTAPMLSVFDAALGIESVFVDVDNTNPGPGDAKRLLQAIAEHDVSNVFLSAAMLEAISHEAEAQQANLPLVRRLITLDASPRVETIARLEKALHIEAQIHSPYGRSRCFPVSNITNHDIDKDVEEMMESGEGVCIGRPLDSVDVKIIAHSDNPYQSLNTTPVLPPGLVGEIIVRANHCSSGSPDASQGEHTIPDDEGRVWHRMGDIGSIDGSGRLWYCGRVSERIDTGQETLYPDQAEALFNQHPDARRTALVGVGPKGKQMPVLCVELRQKLSPANNERVHFDLLQLAQSCGLTRTVRTVLFHPGFPANAANAAALPRAALTRWAAERVKA